MENLVHIDIRGNNNSQLQMAIADLFHCENIQDRAVEYHRFETLLSKERPVGNDFKCPNRRQFGFELLDHNDGSRRNQNWILVGKYADFFGL